MVEKIQLLSSIRSILCGNSSKHYIKPPSQLLAFLNLMHIIK